MSDTKIYDMSSYNRLPLSEGQHVVTKFGIFKCDDNGELIRVDNQDKECDNDGDR